MFRKSRLWAGAADLCPNVSVRVVFGMLLRPAYGPDGGNLAKLFYLALFRVTVPATKFLLLTVLTLDLPEGAARIGESLLAIL